MALVPNSGSRAARFSAPLIAAFVLHLPSAARAQPAPLAPAGPAANPAARPQAAADAAPPISRADALDADRLRALEERMQAQQQRVDAQEQQLKAQAAELSEAKAQQQLATTAESADAEQYRQVLRFYGFTDMGLQRMWIGKGSSLHVLGVSRETTFVLGNVNLYIDAEPIAGWRALTELRFTNYPNGNQESIITQGGVPGIVDKNTSTEVYDVNSSNGGWSRALWGSIVIERAYVEGVVTDWFGVRVGQWFTPYGIWNVDHGTPTLIPLMRPQHIKSQLFPEKQLGVQAFGSLYVGSTELGYHAYVSNGRTATQVDWSDNKMLGGRIYARTSAPFPMAVGTSFFTAQNDDVQRTWTRTVPTPEFSEETTVSYREHGIGVDASADIGALRLRTEFNLNRTDYEPGKRNTIFNIPGTYWGDRTMWGWYGLAAYRLPWLGLEPYAFYEMSREPSIISEATRMYSLGFNIHINEATQLKTQVARMEFFDFEDRGHDHSVEDLSLLATRLVVAF